MAYVTAHAECFVLFPGAVNSAMLDAARAAGTSATVEIALESRPGRVRLVAAAQGTAMEALRAVSDAALALVDAMEGNEAVIDGLRRIESESTRERVIVKHRASLSPRPQTLMSEVSAPVVAPDKQREAFRNFMTRNRLRPTTWAKDAGIPSGEILGYLTGRSRGFSGDVAERLARAAKVRVEDMFR
jgi:hypothetical protein